MMTLPGRDNRAALFRFVLQPWWRLTRAHTLGVRGVVRDARGHVLLVRHTYVKGWHFPGGGVEGTETLETALARELEEEAGIIVETRATLFGIYSNAKTFPRDHIALYLINAYRQIASHSREIAEAGFFDTDTLPAGTTAATRRRLNEIAAGAELDVHW